MNTVEPIRKQADIEKIKGYYRFQKPNSRNYLLIVIGLNTALRISDILKLKWNNVYDFDKKQYREHIYITEKKTEKDAKIYINKSIKMALSYHMERLKKLQKPYKSEDYLFCSKKGDMSISRVQAARIIKEASQECGIAGVISCHSLRKTFGYCAWKNGVSPSLLVRIFNHSSYSITERYLGIEQDDKDEVFKNLNI